MANSVDPDQTAPIGAVCSFSRLFASILNLSVILGNYLQQTTSADDIFRCIFFSALRVKRKKYNILGNYNPYPSVPTAYALVDNKKRIMITGSYIIGPVKQIFSA